MSLFLTVALWLVALNGVFVIALIAYRSFWQMYHQRQRAQRRVSSFPRRVEAFHAEAPTCPICNTLVMEGVIVPAISRAVSYWHCAPCRLTLNRHIEGSHAYYAVENHLAARLFNEVTR